MEKLLKILVIALVMLSGCKTTKKLSESTDFKSSVNAEQNRSVKENEDFRENKDVNSELETVTVTTETEYYEPPSTGSGIGAGSMGQEDRRQETGGKGAVKKQTTTTTTIKKRDTDKSKVEATSEKQEDSSLKKQEETEDQSRKTEVKSQKIGLSWWKVVGGVVALLLAVYFLVRMKIIRNPFLIKIVERITRILNGFHGKAA